MCMVMSPGCLDFCTGKGPTVDNGLSIYKGYKVDPSKELFYNDP